MHAQQDKSLQDVSSTSVDCTLSRPLEKTWNLYNFLSDSELSPDTVGNGPDREQRLQSQPLVLKLVPNHSGGPTLALHMSTEVQALVFVFVFIILFKFKF